MSQTVQYTVFEVEEPTEQFQIQILESEGLKCTLCETLEELVGGELRDIEEKSNGLISVQWVDSCGIEFSYFCIPNVDVYQSWGVRNNLKAAA